jgi:hypothetical protein
MSHRLTHIPLNEEDYNEERNKILAIGIENGYKNKVIEKILQKQEKKIKLQQITTLSNTTTNPTFIRCISLTYYPKLTNKLINIFKKHKIQIINNSNKFKMKYQLESTKNKRDNNSKSGIYKITCGTRRCGFKYTGKSKKAIQTRFT